MRTKLIGTFGLLLLVSVRLFSQQTQSIEVARQKGKFYVNWGWNRAWYANSDISLKGVDYNFTLNEVVARDRPSSFGLKNYFNPENFSTPQFNFRIGFFINDHYSLSIGMDHMKYVLVRDQSTTISGYINHEDSRHNGDYHHNKIVVALDLLAYEHTDGLNYMNIELRRHDKVWDLKSFRFSLIEGVGLGALMPRTDATLLEMDRHNKYHLAGYGLNGLLGLQLGFLRHFFIQSELKGGYMNMPDVRTTNSKSDKASQHFLFAQWNYTLGAKFDLLKKYTKKTTRRVNK
jgi:hypothetical protein